MVLRRHSTALVLLCIGLWGCAGDNDRKDNILDNFVPPGQTTLRVRSLQVKGLEGLDKDDLLSGIATNEDPGWRTSNWVAWIPLLRAQPSYFNEVQWRLDQARVETWLKTKGRFNASVALSKNQRGEWIDLTISIKTREPTKVASITIEGLNSTKIDPATLNIALKKGQTFSSDRYNTAKSVLRSALRDRSYAHALVQGRVVVNPQTRSADVVFFVDPGPRTFIRSITIKGLKDVDKSYVRDAITLVKGQPYSDAALQKTQENIYDLGVFSLVAVRPAFELERTAAAFSVEETATLNGSGTPDITQKDKPEGAMGPLGISDVLSAATGVASQRVALDSNIDVVVQVKEAKKYSVRLGAGFSIESTRQDLHVQANWAARNLFSTLINLEHFNTFGYAVTPGILGLLIETADTPIAERLGNKGVFFDSKLELKKPQFIEQKLEAFVRARVQREVQLGYLGLSPSLSVGLRRTFFEHLRLEASYSLLYYQYQSLDPLFRRSLEQQELIGVGQENPSQFLESLEQRIAWDQRDNVLNPQKGFKVELFLQQAGSYIAGGDFKYFKPMLSVEGYIPFTLGPKWVTALRARAGSIYNLNDPSGTVSRGIPVQSRYFSGGRNAMRSFGSRFLSPFTGADPSAELDPVPVGGTSLIEGSVEQRVKLIHNLLSLGDVWGALYLDTANVLEQPLYIGTGANSDPITTFGDMSSTLLYGIGGGLWWLTPVGPIRFDYAYTLGDVSKNPNFTDPQVRAQLSGYNVYLGIGHSF